MLRNSSCLRFEETLGDDVTVTTRTSPEGPQFGVTRTEECWRRWVLDGRVGKLRDRRRQPCDFSNLHQVIHHLYLTHAASAKVKLISTLKQVISAIPLACIRTALQCSSNAVQSTQLYLLSSGMVPIPKTTFNVSICKRNLEDGRSYAQNCLTFQTSGACSGTDGLANGRRFYESHQRPTVQTQLYKYL